MAAHRYWRVRFSGSTGSGATNYVWIQEAYFRNALGVDVSVGGTAASSSNWDGTYTAAQAFDKSLSGAGWCPANAAFPAWLSYDCVTPVELKTIELVMHSATGYYPFGKIFVEFSDNNSTWTEIGSFTAGTNTSGSTWTLGLSPEGSVPDKRMFGRQSRFYGDQMPQSPVSYRFNGGNAWRWEIQTTGKGRIAGVVTIENIPGSRKVRLYRKHDGMLMRETWSATNGAYSFENLDPNWEYFVVAHDHLRVHNAVVSDMIDPP